MRKEELNLGKRASSTINVRGVIRSVEFELLDKENLSTLQEGDLIVMVYDKTNEIAVGFYFTQNQEFVAIKGTQTGTLAKLEKKRINCFYKEV